MRISECKGSPYAALAAIDPMFSVHAMIFGLGEFFDDYDDEIEPQDDCECVNIGGECHKCGKSFYVPSYADIVGEKNDNTL